MNQEEINNLKRLITKSKIQPVIKKRPKKKIQSRTRWFHRQLLQTHIQERILILVKLLEKTQEEGTLSETISEAPSH